MKKAKTRKNLISILSAILGVVFAFITGVTYCISLFTLEYETHPSSTSAYMANQQYHVINDTVDQPIIYGEGPRNFEIALQYSIPYDFDVRFSYSLSWSNNASNSNVILHFVNRDNIIYDEQYIYFAESVEKGDGKIPFIVGVDFVNTEDATYDGQALTINITNVKIYKKQSDYSVLSHQLTSDLKTYNETTEEYEVNNVAANAWINYKNRTKSGALSYVMMYNYRKNHATGVPYPGLSTAYKKPTMETIVNGETVDKVSGPSWLGGNKAYAGVGMYVIAGSSGLKFNIEVAGIWRTWKDVKENEQEDQTVDEEMIDNLTKSGDEIVDASPQLISENSIKFNYTSDWTHQSWNALKLWETRVYNYEIPANTACFIQILDNIEVTTASRVAPNLYDQYRAVINNITINYGLNGTDSNTHATKFEYSESSAKWLDMKEIKNNSGLTISGSTYQKDDLSVVNSSMYTNGLYSAHISEAAQEQSFETNISLINNTAITKKVTVNFKLNYLMSNGNTVLVDQSGKRAEELVEQGATNFTTDLEAFNQNLYYSYSIESDQIIDSVVVTIAPYSSINVLELYKVNAQLQGTIYTTFKCDYDCWTYLVVTLENFTGTETVEGVLTTEETSEGYQLEKNGLVLEANWNLNQSLVLLSVKNTSTKTLKDIHIKSFSVYELPIAKYEVESNEPADWAASYWQYYKKDGSVYKQLTSNHLNNENTDYNEITVYKKIQSYSPKLVSKSEVGTYIQQGCDYSVSLTGTDSLLDFTSQDEYEGNVKTKKGMVLNPGESLIFAKASVTGTNRFYVAGYAYATKAKAEENEDIALINAGKTNAFLINNSENSYYVRFSGSLKTGAVVENLINPAGDNYNYYIGIIRPGQILTVPMESRGVLEAIKIEDSGIFTAETLTTWSDIAKEQMTKYFALTKTTPQS